MSAKESIVSAVKATYSSDSRESILGKRQPLPSHDSLSPKRTARRQLDFLPTATNPTQSAAVGVSLQLVICMFYTRIKTFPKK